MTTSKSTAPAKPVLFDAAAQRFNAMALRAKEGAKVMAEADKETEANGFLANLRVTEYLDLTFDDLADWNPITDNNATTAINALHYVYSPDSSPMARKAYADAMHLAVCSVPAEKAKAARNGGDNVDDTDARYKAVPIRKISTAGAKAGYFSGTSADANAELAKLAKEAKASGNTVLAETYERAIACATDMRAGEYSSIRRMAADHNRLQQRARRWRSVLYLNILKPALEAYDASNPLTPVGKVWGPACEKALAVHKEYWKDTNEAFVPSAADLEAKIMSEINLLLGVKGDVETAAAAAAAREAENPGETLVKAIQRALAAAQALDHKMTGIGAKRALEVALTDPRTAGAFQEEYGIDIASVLGGKGKGKGTATTAPAAPNSDDTPAPAKPQRAQAAPAAPAGNVAKPTVRKAVATPTAPTTASGAQAALDKIKSRSGKAA